MEAPRLTCGFRLYHFAASLKEGGAAASCRGEPRGSAMAADLIKDNVLSAYLGASAPAEQENDAEPRGFAEDSDLQARSAARPEVSRLASANASACRVCRSCSACAASTAQSIEMASAPPFFKNIPAEKRVRHFHKGVLPHVLNFF